MKPYFADEYVTLFLGDCREVTEWLAADVLVTDPPYGRDWSNHSGYNHGVNRGRRAGIVGDRDTSARDVALASWGADKPAFVFGDLLLAPPSDAKQVLIYRKPGNSGFFGGVNGFRRDAEAIYILGRWPAVPVATTSIIATTAKAVWSVTNCGHPHAKPVDVMETLIAACPPGVVADPFAGAGSTLVAARNLGRRAVGVELDERYAERAAKRLCQGVLEST